jgi:hypothetical protein
MKFNKSITIEAPKTEWVDLKNKIYYHKNYKRIMPGTGDRVKLIASQTLRG